MSKGPKNERTREAIVKLQSVRVIPVTIGGSDGSTIGQMIDSMLHTAEMEGTIPNKLVLDLNPPRDTTLDLD